MKKILIVLSLLIVLGSAYWYYRDTTTSKDTITTKTSSPTQSVEKVSVFAKNLNVPWDMVFLPDGSMLVTERLGRIQHISLDGKLQKKPIAVLSQVHQIGEGGLLGISLHPNFTNNHFIYLYYTYASDKKNTQNRVSRFTFTNNTLKDEKIIVDQIPGASNHNGGRIRFGPDNYLYITTGDAQEPSLAQDKNALAGKILRVTDSGQPAPKNPFNTCIYSYGHRNPQGITWSPDGTLYATEHGRSGIQSGLDELNRIEAGKNYGWPVIQGDEERKGMITPLINSGPSTTWAPSGAAYFKGAVYFAGLRGQSLYKATDSEDKVTIVSFLSHQYGRLRNVIVGPDEYLYVSTSNRDGRGNPTKDDDMILKINPQLLK